MSPTDLAALVKGMAPAIKEAIAAALVEVETRHAGEVAALRADLSALRERAAVPGPVGPPGPQGERGERGADGAKGETGDRGANGAPGQHGESGPAGERGLPGEKGERGDIGPAGQDAPAPTVEQIKAALSDMPDALTLVVSKHFEAHPVPAGKDGAPGIDGKDGTRGADGAPGRDGADGRDGKDGASGRDGIDGKDGIGLAGGLIDRDGALVLTRTDGTTQTLGLVVGAKGADGAPGRDGLDGLGFEDLSFEYDDRGRLYAVYTRGEVSKRTRVPGFHFQEVYKAGTSYLPGDVIQWGGDMWVARAEGELLTPGTGATAAQQWRMAVRRGREGKAGPKGDAGERGPKGEQGERGPDRW